ncbi:MAG TPA: G8 domain-containing protein [Pirellulales bacterium]
MLLAAETDATPAAVVYSAKSGNWSDPAVWESGRTPTNGDRVLVKQGHEVVYDVASESVIRVLKVAGTLRFAIDRNTRLDVGLLRVEPGDEVTEEGFDCHNAATPVDPTGERNDRVGSHALSGIRMTAIWTATTTIVAKHQKSNRHTDCTSTADGTANRIKASASSKRKRPADNWCQRAVSSGRYKTRTCDP